MALRQPAVATRHAGRRTLLRYRISLNASPTYEDANAHDVCSDSGALLRKQIKESHVKMTYMGEECDHNLRGR
jgi:hypothetical protein